ncbi:MAG: hypothetical protein AAGA56_26375, partial [Myxococcota bacterium]
WLDLSSEQEAALVDVIDGLKQKLAPMERRLDAVIEAATGAVRRCDAQTPALSFALEGVVAEGESIRPAILKAIDRAHAILTPAQRRQVSAHLLEGGRRKAKEKRRKKAQRGVTKLDVELDLSWRQVATIGFRVVRLHGDFEDRTERWQRAYRNALAAFAHDDFRSRDHSLARAPVVQLAADFVKQLLAQVLPVLDPPQCRALGEMLAKTQSERHPDSVVEDAR